MRTGVDPIAILDGIIKEFVDDAAETNFQAFVAVGTFKDEHRSRRVKADSQSKPGNVMGALISCADPSDDLSSSGVVRHYPLTGHEATGEELLNWLEDGINLELCWFLATVFESHERCLKDLYAAIGFIEPSYWRGSDYGTELISDINSKDFDWYKNKVRECAAKHNCDEILSQLRRRFEEFCRLEQTTWRRHLGAKLLFLASNAGVFSAANRPLGWPIS